MNTFIWLPALVLYATGALYTWRRLFRAYILSEDKKYVVTWPRVIFIGFIAIGAFAAATWCVFAIVVLSKRLGEIVNARKFAFFIIGERR